MARQPKAPKAHCQHRAHATQLSKWQAQAQGTSHSAAQGGAAAHLPPVRCSHEQGCRSCPRYVFQLPFRPQLLHGLRVSRRPDVVERIAPGFETGLEQTRREKEGNRNVK
jgi:hypothetical protein